MSPPFAFFYSKFELRRAMYFTYFEALGSAF